MDQKIFLSHRHKIMFGTPIIFLLLLHGNTTVGGESFSFSLTESPFREVGDEITVTLNVRAETPLNAVGGKIAYPTTLMEISSIQSERSIIDLWSEEPFISPDIGSIDFSGGILREGGFVGEGNIVSVTFKALAEGTAVISLSDGMLLAHNGAGTNSMRNATGGEIAIRARGTPSPDINNDGQLSMSDINSEYLSLFRDYDQRYDLNQDNKLTWADVRTLIKIVAE